jgi:hypothetical protein
VRRTRRTSGHGLATLGVREAGKRSAVDFQRFGNY